MEYAVPKIKAFILSPKVGGGIVFSPAGRSYVFNNEETAKKSLEGMGETFKRTCHIREVNIIDSKYIL